MAANEPPWRTDSLLAALNGGYDSTKAANCECNSLPPYFEVDADWEPKATSLADEARPLAVRVYSSSSRDRVLRCPECGAIYFSRFIRHDQWLDASPGGDHDARSIARQPRPDADAIEEFVKAYLTTLVYVGDNDSG